MKPKVVYLASARSIHTVKWVNSLVEQDYEITLITMHKPNLYVDISPKIKVIILPFKSGAGYYLNYLSLKKKLKRIKPDLFHVHYASGYGTLARLVNYKPILLSVWGSDVYLFPRTKFTKRILKKNLNFADYLASTSEAMALETRKYFDSNKHIYLTPFGVNTEMFNYHKKDKSKIVVGTVKSLEYVYGIDRLIKVFSLVIEELEEKKEFKTLDNIELLIVGEGQEEEKYKNMVFDLNLSEYVKFSGKIKHSEVSRKLEDFDVFCAFSRSESFGVSVIEASAKGIPVIVWNTGGLPEVVNDKTGVIVDTEIAAKNALMSLIKNKEKRVIMGLEGRNFIKKNYSWTYSLKKMNELYQTILDDNMNK